MIAIRDRELAPDRDPPLAHFVGAVQVHLCSSDADHPGAQNRNQLELPGAVRGVAQERSHSVGLPLLDVEQEHVRRIGGHLQRELVEQARLQ